MLLLTQMITTNYYCTCVVVFGAVVSTVRIDFLVLSWQSMQIEVQTPLILMKPCSHMQPQSFSCLKLSKIIQTNQSTSLLSSFGYQPRIAKSMWATDRSTSSWSKSIETGNAITIESILNWDLQTIMVRPQMDLGLILSRLAGPWPRHMHEYDPEVLIQFAFGSQI